MSAAPHLVMVVDDDQEIRETVHELLLDEGYRVMVAANGREALDLLVGASELPCVILLDLMMPVMNGWALVAELTADPRLADIPVIAITAAGPQAARIDVKQILPKPVRIDQLIGAIETYC